MKLNIPLIISCATLLPFLVEGAKSGKAPKVKKNPKNIVAIADFPFGFDKGVRGNVVFSSKDGKEVNVHVDMTGLPESGGPFYYHIHEKSVPGDGNCDAVGLHFNPYGAPPDCENQKDDSYCQVGDLSGKHGWIDTTCFETKYTDPFLSLNKKSKAYIVGRSLVFHFANMTKFACADIELASNLRLNSLIEEYSLDEDLDFQLEVAEGYLFDEEDALSAEIFEAEAEQQDTEDLFPRKELIASTNHTSFNSSWPHNFSNGTEVPVNHTNHTNSSNVSSNQYDYENGTSFLTIGISVLSAAIASFLI